MQKRLYKDLLTKNVSALQGAEGAGRTQLLNLAMQLRKACNHPYLFEGMPPRRASRLSLGSSNSRVVVRLYTGCIQKKLVIP